MDSNRSRAQKKTKIGKSPRTDNLDLDATLRLLFRLRSIDHKNAYRSLSF